MRIRPFADADLDAVIALWRRCDLVRPWNDPRKDIQRKLGTQPELFLVGDLGGWDTCRTTWSASASG